MTTSTPSARVWVHWAIHAIARARPAAVAGNVAAFCTAPLEVATTARVWVRTWVSTPMTN